MVIILWRGGRRAVHYDGKAASRIWRAQGKCVAARDHRRALSPQADGLNAGSRKCSRIRKAETIDGVGGDDVGADGGYVDLQDDIIQIAQLNAGGECTLDLVDRSVAAIGH